MDIFYGNVISFIYNYKIPIREPTHKRLHRTPEAEFIEIESKGAGVRIVLNGNFIT